MKKCTIDNFSQIQAFHIEFVLRSIEKSMRKTVFLFLGHKAHILILNRAHYIFFLLAAFAAYNLRPNTLYLVIFIFFSTHFGFWVPRVKDQCFFIPGRGGVR